MQWFVVVEWSSVRKTCVFNCFLKVVMFLAVQVKAGSSFLQKGAERVKVLESDLESDLIVTMRHSSLILHIN